jgi:uncharacterized protein
MATIRIFFDEALVPLLDPPRISDWTWYPFQGSQSLKHMIEALGVPHTEIGTVLVDGQYGSMGDIARDGSEVKIFPPRPVELAEGEARFILDVHLGRLASYLRILGLDTLYRNDYQDDELARLAQDDRRVLLTRDKRLLMRSSVTQGALLCSLQPRVQLEEINRRYGLIRLVRPFQRCPRCNGQLHPASKEAVLTQLEPLTKRYFDEFHRCAECDQVYWKGSHYERMLRMIQSLGDPTIAT